MAILFDRRGNCFSKNKLITKTSQCCTALQSHGTLLQGGSRCSAAGMAGATLQGAVGSGQVSQEAATLHVFCSVNMYFSGVCQAHGMNVQGLRGRGGVAGSSSWAAHPRLTEVTQRTQGKARKGGQMEDRVAEPGGPAAQLRMTAAIHLHSRWQCRAGSWPG